MSFRYVVHLKTGERIRSKVIDDKEYDSTFSSLTEFMGFVAGGRSFTPEPKDTDVEIVIVDRQNISHISIVDASKKK